MDDVHINGIHLGDIVCRKSGRGVLMRVVGLDNQPKRAKSPIAVVELVLGGPTQKIQVKFLQKDSA